MYFFSFRYLVTLYYYTILVSIERITFIETYAVIFHSFSFDLQKIRIF